MVPSISRRPSFAARLLAAAVAALVAVALAACAPQAGGSVDPSGPCTADAQHPGAYPELERRIPATFRGAAPERLDSGRNCSPGTLGTLGGHGIDQLQFAGGLWPTGSRSGVTLAIFRAEGLTMTRLAEFYESGARQARKTEAVSVSDLRLQDVAGRRLDTLNDESFQTIVVLEDPQPGLVRAVLVASDIREVGTKAGHEAVVQAALEASVAP